MYGRSDCTAISSGAASRGGCASALPLACFILLACATTSRTETLWMIERVPGDPVNGQSGSLAIDAQGNAHLGYSVIDGSDRDIGYARREGGSWHTEIADGSDVVDAVAPRIAVSPSGVPHLVYYENQPYIANLRHATRSEGAWTTELIDPHGSRADVAVDADGNPNVYYGKFAEQSGGGWTIEETGLSFVTASLALNAQGEPCVSYQAMGPTPELGYAWRTGGVWTSEIVDDTGVTGFWNSLAVDDQGDPHLSYSAISGEGLRYAHKSGGVWTLETVGPPGSGGQTSIAVDAQGFPHVGHYLGDSALLYSRRSATGWVTDTVDLDAGLWCSLALDAGGDPRIAFYDETNGGLRYARGLLSGGPTRESAAKRAPTVGGLAAIGSVVIFPNPFVSETRISWVAGGAADLEATVYNAAGRRVSTLAAGRMSSGAHSVAWDGRDDSGRSVASGVYFLRLRAEGSAGTKRITLAR